ncbi:MAG: hypothetical protein WC479_09755 [Candidatus Izemoplasmatales bacterium]
MELKDVIFSYQWDKKPGESDEDYEDRYAEMTKVFIDDYRTNGELVIINYGFPLTKPLLIRARQYIASPSIHRDKIIQKTIPDVRAMYSNTTDGLKDEITTSVGNTQIRLLRKKRHIDYLVDEEVNRIEKCSCALCFDKSWVYIVYPLFYREKYYVNGFVNKGGHPISCPACLAFAKPPEEKHHKNLVREGDRYGN